VVKGEEMKKPMWALLLIAGCYSAAPAGQHVWTIRVPKTVALENKLVFTVETNAPDGTAFHDVPYVWRVDWVGVQGTRHQGYSFTREKITAKGTPGNATLRILAYDPGGDLVEVASATIEVTPMAEPPAH
jgi:hypothetical protein